MNPDFNITLYSTAELEVMKRRIEKKQSSVFRLEEIEPELEKRKLESLNNN